MKCNKDNAIACFLSFLLIIALVTLGLKTFTLWGQVTDIWEGHNLLWSDVLIHPHGPRYALVFPIFTLSKLIGTDYNIVFSYSCVILITLTISLNISISRKILSRRLTFPELCIIPIFYLSLASLMNGRILFAIAGSSLFFFSIINEKKGVYTIFHLTIAIIFCSVSSGTLSIMVIWMVVCILWGKNENHSYTIIKMALLGVFFLIFGNFLAIVTKKNIDYYGGGLEGAFNMLNHGIGKIAFIDEAISFSLYIIFFSVAIIVLSNITLLSQVRIKKHSAKLYFLFAIGLSGGLFGFSTLAVSIPPLIAILTQHYGETLASQHTHHLERES